LHDLGPRRAVGSEVDNSLIYIAETVKKAAAFAERRKEIEYPPDDYCAE